MKDRLRRWFERLPRPASLLVTGLTASCVIFVLVVLSYAFSPIFDYALGKEQKAARISRLLGYLASESQLETSLSSTQEARSELVYQAMESNQAGAQMQQSLRSQAEVAGLVVTGSRLSTPSETDKEAGHSRLSVDLTLRGTPESLDSFLASVLSHRPLLNVEKLLISARRIGVGGRNQQLDPAGYLEVRATVAALRVRAEK